MGSHRVTSSLEIIRKLEEEFATSGKIPKYVFCTPKAWGDLLWAWPTAYYTVTHITKPTFLQRLLGKKAQRINVVPDQSLTSTISKSWRNGKYFVWRGYKIDVIIRNDYGK